MRTSKKEKIIKKIEVNQNYKKSINTKKREKLIEKEEKKGDWDYGTFYRDSWICRRTFN